MSPAACQRSCYVRAAAFLQDSFEFSKRHFDGVEIGSVRRQEQEPSPAFGKCGFGVDRVVRLEIVENDDIAACQRRSELRFDMEIKGTAVHRTWNDPWCRQARTPQTGNERLVGPNPRAVPHPAAAHLSAHALAAG